MVAPLDASQIHVRLWVSLAAGALAIALLTALFFFDTWLTDKRWILYVATVPTYLLLEVFAEGALQVLWSAGRWAGRFFAVAVVGCFYLVWFWQL